ncbi:GON-4-like protein [Cloeon dipterum]|uniref:GON-4-like protein n=1 Tax=Cloeon dipterum TaxID=197152 RepID=UPI0032206E08
MADNNKENRVSSPQLDLPSKSSPTVARKHRSNPDDASEDCSSSSDELMINEVAGPNGKARRQRRIKTKDLAQLFVQEGLNEVEDEIEEQLDSKAKKSKLTIGNVKNILRHVISNQHVLAMVKKSMREEGDGGGSSDDEQFPYEPKLTRAKTKELLMTKAPIPWSVSPVKVTPGSATKQMIDQVQDDSTDDEEYQPNEDEAEISDEDCNSSLASDIEQVMTPNPMTPKSNADCSTQTIWTDDGLFKMPNSNFELMENIGMRTRSKVSYTDTPLEVFEQSFIPPDITEDMYETDCDNEDWKQFLHLFVQPINIVNDIPDDDEADPEYNVLEDHEAVDQEELRADRAVKVSKKEVNELISELRDYMASEEENEADATQTDGVPDPEIETAEAASALPVVYNSPQVVHLIQLSPSNFLIPGTPPSMRPATIETVPAQQEEVVQPVAAEAEQTVAEALYVPEPIFDVNQRLLLNQQMMQHVQLLGQHYMQSTINPDMALQATEMKENLFVLRNLGGTNPKSGFYAQNLDLMLETVEKWDKSRKTEQVKKEMNQFYLQEKSRCDSFKKSKLLYRPSLNVHFMKALCSSAAFVYPALLPNCGFNPYPMQKHQTFFPSEDFLISLGLEQFLPHLQEEGGEKKATLMNASQLIGEFMLPVKSARSIYHRIKLARRELPDNPIHVFLTTSTTPQLVHQVYPVDFITPSQQPESALPPTWKLYIHGKNN